jgi:hypothetical protein
MKAILIALLLMLSASLAYTQLVEVPSEPQAPEPDWPNGFHLNEEPFDRVALGEANFNIEFWLRIEGEDIWYFATVPGSFTYFVHHEPRPYCSKIRAVTKTEPVTALSPFSVETCTSQTPEKPNNTKVK